MTIDPDKLSIVHYPAEILRQKARSVEVGGADLSAIARRMIELMREAEGIGLAAPQVGLPIRMFVVDVPPDGDRTDGGPLPSATAGPVVYLNPVLSGHEGVPEAHEEGCLSLPDVRGDVLRPPTVTLSGFDLEGRPISGRATGLLARCWQHELDHLDGVLILDRMTQMSRLRNRSAIRELERSVHRL